MPEKEIQNVTVLGATGSIGCSALEVIAENSEQFKIFALSASRNIEKLFEQCLRFKPVYAVVTNSSDVDAMNSRLKEAGVATEVLHGVTALEQVAAAHEVDVVVAAIVGAAGLRPTLAGVAAGKKVLLANKEALVMSGQLFNDAVAKHNAMLLPVDSEHNAIFQCLPYPFKNLSDAGIDKILLTGSGGPFREVAPSQLSRVTPAQACAHPNWSMGKKISVDSATMMNKGLEFIEACWLFHAKSSDIEVLIHPQSIVHSMVQYRDGSVLAQLGQPDMRTPIAHCLAWPKRVTSGVAPLDFTQMKNLTFEAPDFDRFPSLKLAIEVAAAGKDFAVALNAANEVAVQAFLDERLPFTGIAPVIAEVLENWDGVEPLCIDAVIDADSRARHAAEFSAAHYKH